MNYKLTLATVGHILRNINIYHCLIRSFLSSPCCIISILSLTYTLYKLVVRTDAVILIKGNSEMALFHCFYYFQNLNLKY